MPLHVSLIRFLIAGVDQLVAGPTSAGQKATAKTTIGFCLLEAELMMAEAERATDEGEECMESAERREKEKKKKKKKGKKKGKEQQQHKPPKQRKRNQIKGKGCVHVLNRAFSEAKVCASVQCGRLGCACLSIVTTIHHRRLDLREEKGRGER